jgi:EKC/KEOPS complex subunit CGI121/TPRKB
MTLFSAHYAHHPPALTGVHIALFTSVTNAAALRAQIVQAATLEGNAGDMAREAVDFAFVDTRLVRFIIVSVSCC